MAEFLRLPRTPTGIWNLNIHLVVFGTATRVRYATQIQKRRVEGINFRPVGPKRVRVGQCVAVISAEWVYDRLLRQRATRLYAPVAGLQPRCRTCWGLTYQSRQQNNYKDSLGSVGRLGGHVA